MPGYRGRLIFPLVAEIYRVDWATTATDPDAGGPFTSGYDPVYREVVKIASVDRLGSTARKEYAAVKLQAQFEPAALLRIQEIMTGNAASGKIVCVFHFADLEAASLVNSTTGESLIKIGDRLGAIRRTDDTLVQTIRTPPGLYVTEALPLFGLDGNRNLLQVTLDTREQGK